MTKQTVKFGAAMKELGNACPIQFYPFGSSGLRILALACVLIAVGPGRASAQESVYSGAFAGGNGGIANNLAGVIDFETNAAKGVSIVNFFKNWDDNTGFLSFPTSSMDAIRNHGSIPMLTWQPEGASADSVYALGNIINGNFDSFIRDWAADAKAWGHPFFLRFAHEMNGTWYPWCANVNGNSSADYIAAWRHVHDIFVNLGATNVTWVWCVNTKFTGSASITGLYPGDNYVDWISLDSYNRISNTWGDFSDRSQATLDEITGIAPGKPVLVAETGCHEDDTDPDRKGQWYRNAMKNYLKWSMPRIKAWCYFNGNNPDGNDWRITTSTNALAGYQDSIGLSYYSSNRFGAIADCPIQPQLNDAQTNDTMDPFVSIVKPAMNHVRTGTTVEIRAEASDKSGITKVVFSTNGVLARTENLYPYQFFWPVPTNAGLNITVTAKAYDTNGNTAVSTVQLVTQDAGIVTLTNSDGIGSNSFIAPGNWDGGQMPTAGNDYVVPAGLTFRTPTDNEPYAFAGDSLTLSGVFVFKQTNVLTVADLRLTNGSVANYSTGGDPAIGRLAGSINVLANGTIDAGGTNLFMHIMASIHGSGGLTLPRPSTVYLSGDASAYTGTWTNYGSNIEIWSGATNPLGSGVVYLKNNTNALTFNAGNDLAIPAAITGGGYVVKQNSNTVTLTGNNTFSGGTTVNQGVLQIGNGGALCGGVTNSGGTLTVASGGSLYATNLTVGFNSLNSIASAVAGATVNVGSGPANSLAVGYRTVSTTGISAFGQMDVSGLSAFTANVGNLLVGVNANAGGTGASAANGQLLLATNNTIVATNFLVGSSPGSPSGSSNVVVLGSGNNVIATPVLIIGGPKENGILNLKPGGSLTLNNGAGRADMTVGGENFSTSVTPPASMADLSAGSLVASVNTLTIGLKSGGSSGGDSGTLVLGSSAANNVNVNTLVIGSLSGAASGSPVAQGSLTFGGGNFLVNSNVILGNFSGSFGSAAGTLSVNGGTFAVAGNILSGGGTSTLNVSGGSLVLSNQAGAPGMPLTFLNITNAALHLNVNGNVPKTNIVAATVGAAGTTMITVDSVTNISGSMTVPLISYGGADPFSHFALAPLPAGYAGNLVDNSAAHRIDLNIGLSSPPPAPTIQPSVMNLTNFTMQVVSQTGYNYILEASPGLAPGVWAGIKTNPGGGTLIFTVPVGVTNPQQFFRVRVQ